jgi:hypothetical protein
VQPTDSHPGCLVIASQAQRGPVTRAYLVQPVRDNGRVIGYRLRMADGTLSHLAADLSSCDCGAATLRRERPEGGCSTARPWPPPCGPRTDQPAANERQPRCKPVARPCTRTPTHG